ncbi:hypothetical protein AGDE_05428 [Angomonas deanei]|uniref:SCAMP family, putative n=1 Tax=Angomonas deanei TaxID=59799 RepID=A0A7G2CC80_9TRYP|nr:hypothetical protein AGDE_05428 [Angomonas deanei]CAD2217119.1 SCAMP family, putative [Angomonas deanei]|eukprot:EPY38501.1 hypothetical protein AGDE_05428 [Angomonas deanei]
MSEEEKSQVDLERRWKNALAEEQRLNKLSEKVQMQAGESTEPPDNFPPKFLCIRPFMYHSMDAVMPERRKFVTMCFWEWVAVSIALIYNMIAVIITIALPDREDAVIKRNVNKPAQIVLSIVFVIGIPISFFTWYWRIYRACCTRNPAQHFVALCSLILDLGWFVFVLIGPLSCGVCGIIYTIYVSERKVKGLVVLPIIVLVLSAGFIGFTLFKIVKEFIFYRKDLAFRRSLKRQMAYAPEPNEAQS